MTRNVTALRLGLFAVLVALFVVPAFAQLDTGAITGRITDPTGAVVAGAAITVVQTETNFEYPSQTNSEGIFRVQGLRAGPYRVTIVAPGFKKLVREGLDLRIGDNMGLDERLEIGGVTESVEVTGAAPLLETQTSSTGTVMEGEYYYSLFTNQRWEKGVMHFTPGVTYTGVGAWSGSLGNFRIMGQGNIGYFEDGVIAGQENNGNTMDTIANSVEEVKIITTALPAEYGHTAGGAITIVKKSGTNSFHGLANYLNGTRRMQHRGFFSLMSQTQTGADNFVNFPELNLAGPVYLPKIYNGKNKTFFAVSFQDMFSSFTNSTYWSAPSTAMVGGDFSNASAIAAGAPSTVNMNPIYDPASLVFNCNTTSPQSCVKTPLPNNIIPKNRFSALANALLGTNPFAPGNIPGSWTSTGPSNNIFSQQPATLVYDTYSYRVDHQISDKIKVYAGETIGRKVQYNLMQPSLSDQTWDANRNKVRTTQTDPSLGMVWMISPKLVSETKLGQYRYWSSGDVPGLMLVSDLYRTQAKIPNIGSDWYFNQLSVYGTSFGQGTPNLNVTNTRDLKEDLTTLWRNHAFKMGYEWVWKTTVAHNIPNTSVTYSYGGSGGVLANGNSVANTGNSLAEFEMGYVSGTSYTKQGPSWLPVAANHNFYIQDDWKVSPTLTLNLGVRYTNENPLRTKFNGWSVFDPNLLELNAAGSPLFTAPAGYGCPSTTGCLGGYEHGVGAINNRDNNNFQPRFGVAWHPMEKWVFRGGFALMTQDLNYWYSDRSEYDQSVSQSAPTGSPSGYYLFNINQGPTPWAFPAQRADGSTPYSGNFQSRSTEIVNPKLVNPYTMTWNVSLQYQVAKNYALQLSYEGSASLKQTGNAAWNSRPYAMIPNPNGNGTWLNLADPANTTFRAGTFNTYSSYFRPWINWGTVNYFSNFGDDHYHSGTIKLEKRYSQGVTLLTFGTWSKNLNWGPGNPYLNWADNKNYSNDQRLRWVSSLTWELPVGKGRKFFNRGGWFNYIFGQYDIAWTYSIFSGFPASISTTGITRLDYPSYMPTFSGSGFLLQNPQLRDHWEDLGGDRFTQANQNSLINCGAWVHNWGNSCVAVVPNYTNGDIGMSPWYTQRQIAATSAVTKDFPIHERMKLHFRFDFQNPFKWFNWNQPGTSVDVGNISNYQSNFGKMLTEPTTSGLGGVPLIRLELALMW